MNKQTLTMQLLILLDDMYEKGELSGYAMGNFADCIIASHRLISFNCSSKIFCISFDMLKLLQELSHIQRAVENNTIYFRPRDYALFRTYVFTVNKALAYISESSICEAVIWVANNKSKQGRAKC